MPLQVERIRAVLFDVDGTLSDTDDYMVTRLARRLEPFSRLLPQRSPQLAARRIVMGIESPGNFLYTIPDLLGIDDELYNLVARLIRRKAGVFWLIPGVAAMLAALAGRYPLAVVSARDEKGTRTFLEQHRLHGYFGAVATAHTCPHTKPFPDPVVWAAARLGYAAEECLMVGDTTVDIRAGRRAGAQTVGVLCGFGERRELERAGAHLILETTAELAPILLAPSGG